MTNFSKQHLENMNKLLLAILALCFTTTSLAATFDLTDKMHIQYAGVIDLNLPDVTVYNVDLMDITEGQITTLKANGKKVICYFSAWSYEKWRPDADQIDSAAIGRTMDGWPDERWLDIRNLAALMPVMTERMKLAVSKGCDAVDPDNVDGYANKTGFPLTASHQLTYNKALANKAHSLGLMIGLKNDVDQINKLQYKFDFAVNEECFEYNECAPYNSFINAGKPVFQIEYKNTIPEICSDTRNVQKKKLSLNAYREIYP